MPPCRNKNKKNTGASPRVNLPPRHLLLQMPPLHRSGTVPLLWRGSSALALRGGYFVIPILFQHLLILIMGCQITDKYTFFKKKYILQYI
ncbi:MAG: hypothetical protein FWG85_02010 [Bacteroidetes bacterium]|nr:hypothetical protein [Bacteroidota bacterium]